MKALKIIAVMIFVLGLTVEAQTGLESGTQYGQGEDSATCLTNYSLFSEYAKQKNYSDAIVPWTYCFENCPAAGKGIYIYGVNIVKWEIKNSSTKEEKLAKIDKLMKVYDQRIKYFGNSDKYPSAYLLGKKAIDLKTLKAGDKVALKESYDWLQQSLEGLEGNNASTVKKLYPLLVNHYMALSFSFYAQDEISGERLIADYDMVQTKLDVMIAEGGNQAGVSTSMKVSFEETFANCGAADCGTLEAMYGPRYEASPADQEVLTKILTLFDKTNCTDSQLYYKASEAMHKINPTAGSAAGVAKMYLAQDNAPKALDYYKEAITLEEDLEKKAQYQYTAAYILFSKNKNFPEARTYARQAIMSNPKWGDPYILVGQLYAQSAQKQTLGKKDIENQAGYWAAVDMFTTAKRLDPEVVSEADRLIKIYTNYFPTKEEIFFQPDYEAGKTVTVGGWIRVPTVVRSKD
jgi:tetratricopeptide (TPR) repeat protein